MLLSKVRFSANVLVNHGRRRVVAKDEVDEPDAEGSGGGDAGGGDQTASVESQLNDGAWKGGRRTREERVSPERSDPGGRYRFVTFRMVRLGRVQLRDVRVQVQAQYWVAGQTAFGDRDSHKGRVVTLKLEQDYFTTLEQLQVRGAAMS